MTKMLRRREVESVCGLARATIYMMMAEGRFPRPVRIGQTAVAWPDHEIEAWLQTKIAERDAEVAG